MILCDQILINSIIGSTEVYRWKILKVLFVDVAVSSRESLRSFPTHAQITPSIFQSVFYSEKVDQTTNPEKLWLSWQNLKSFDNLKSDKNVFWQLPNESCGHIQALKVLDIIPHPQKLFLETNEIGDTLALHQ